MATDSPKITFVEWGANFSALIKPALPGTSRQYIRREVKHAEAGAAMIGKLAVVLRIEGRELVVVAAAGKGLLPATDAIYQFAQKHGISTIRFHTRRKGLLRHVKKWPFFLIEQRGTESIYRMRVLHG